MAIVVVEDLHTRYGDNHAVHGRSLPLDEGEVLGALGTLSYAALEAPRTRPRAWLRWWLIAGLTVAQAAGIVVVRQRATIASAGGVR